jgi:hypothetical protein
MEEQDQADTVDLLVEFSLKQFHYKAFSVLSLLWGLWDTKKPLKPRNMRLKWTCVTTLQRITARSFL